MLKNKNGDKVFGFSKKNSIKYNLIHATGEEIRELEKSSALTYYSNPLNEETILSLIANLQKHTGLNKPELDIYTFTGKEFNELYDMTAYDDDDSFLCFKLDNWADINKLAYNRGGGRWLDDIVDNLKANQQ